MASKNYKDFKLEVQQNGEKDQRADAGEWIPAFLTTLAQTANVYLACRAAGISRKTAYAWKEANQGFADMWKDAMEDGIDALEYTARKRAMMTSDKLAQFLLEVHRYGRRQQLEHTGPAGGPIPISGNVVTIIDDGEDDDEDKD
jgi:hypothetical protein